MLKDYGRLFIDGNWVDPHSRDLLTVVSPVDGKVIATAPEGDREDIDSAVRAARRAFDEGPWPRMSLDERLKFIEELATQYGTQLDEMSDLIRMEMGSNHNFARAVQGPAAHLLLSELPKLVDKIPWEETRDGYAGKVVVRREPVGVVGAITPWNVPQYLIMCKLVPALLAGCTVVVKPAPETPLDALALAELIDSVGFPNGVVNVVTGGSSAGDALVRHPEVDKISFTGSNAVGRSIGAICGESLRRCSLELGGKSAAVILEDADLDSTVEGLRWATFMNSGQVCAAQTRILAPKSRYVETVDALADLAEGMPVGDPAEVDTEVGPLVTHRQQDRVRGYINIGISEGARLVCGGPDAPVGLESGCFVRPTVFADATNDMRISREEIFGPVATVIQYEDVADAIRIANDSDYGLGGSVWTTDTERGLDVARQIRTGTLGINGYTTDIYAPFGGYKGSGLGRELGIEGFLAFTELKSIAL